MPVKKLSMGNLSSTSVSDSMTTPVTHASDSTLQAKAKLEFAVAMKCNRCTEDIKHRFNDVQGISNVEFDLDRGSVVVETTLPVQEIQQLIESTGRRAVLRGLSGRASLGAAVAMLGGEAGYSVADVRGVVRFVQLDDQECMIDGVLDGLSPGQHGLHVHECGDISAGCQSVGDHYNPSNAPHGSPTDSENRRHAGDLGNITADENGRANFRITDNILKVWDVIGRSLVVTEQEDDLGRTNHPLSAVNGNSGLRLSCGIIARSAGVFENPKTICACDGVSLWDEREKPLAGPSRRQPHQPSNL